MSPANSQSFTEGDESGVLLERIDRFVNQLRLQNNLVVQQRINQFFYMEKAAELRVLIHRLEDLRSTVRILEEKEAECVATVSRSLASDEIWFHDHCRLKRTM